MEIKTKKFYYAKSDILFKMVVASEKGKDILKAIIEDALKIKLDFLEILNNELTLENIKEQGKRVDCLAKCGDTIYNVEINASNRKYIRERNLRYVMSKHVAQFEKGEGYYKVKKSIQINLDWDVNYDKVKKEYMLREADNNDDLFSENIKIYSFDMEKLRKLCYTKNKKSLEYKYLTMLAIDNKKDLLEYSKGDKIMEKYSEKTIEINEKDMYNDMFTKEEDDALLYKSAIECARG